MLAAYIWSSHLLLKKGQLVQLLSKTILPTRVHPKEIPEKQTFIIIDHKQCINFTIIKYI